MYQDVLSTKDSVLPHYFQLQDRKKKKRLANILSISTSPHEYQLFFL